MRARRALLYMPGDEMHKILKASRLRVDCICMDMEDGVALNRKSAARNTIAEALRSVNFGDAERLARINPFGSGLENEDLEAVLPAHPDGIVIPKVSSADHIHWASAQIAHIEAQNGWQYGEIGLLVIVETALGIINLREIAQADSRLRALIFGAEDLAGDIGATRTLQGWEVFYARSAVVTYASAFDLQAIDIVYNDFRDIDGLRLEAHQGATMGYSGKQIIHPNQVIPVQEAFTPSDEAIRHAKQLIDAYALHQAEGRGAFAIDGRLVDAPIIRAAEQVLARAKAAGKK